MSGIANNKEQMKRERTNLNANFFTLDTNNTFLGLRFIAFYHLATPPMQSRINSLLANALFLCEPLEVTKFEKCGKVISEHNDTC